MDGVEMFCASAGPDYLPLLLIPFGTVIVAGLIAIIGIRMQITSGESRHREQMAADREMSLRHEREMVYLKYFQSCDNITSLFGKYITTESLYTPRDLKEFILATDQQCDVIIELKLINGNSNIKRLAEELSGIGLQMTALMREHSEADHSQTIEEDHFLKCQKLLISFIDNMMSFLKVANKELVGPTGYQTVSNPPIPPQPQ